MGEKLEVFTQCMDDVDGCPALDDFAAGRGLQRSRVEDLVARCQQHNLCKADEMGRDVGELSFMEGVQCAQVVLMSELRSDA